MLSKESSDRQSDWRNFLILAEHAEGSGALAKAEQGLKEALSLASTVSLEETLIALNYLADFYRRQEKYKEAEEFSGVAALNHKHSPATAALYFLCYGRLLIRAGDLEYAEQILRTSLQCHEAAAQIDPFLISSIIDGLARVLNDQQRPDEASQLWEKYRQYHLSIGL
jgi:tetratricopeptide (TPR) repeat protein